MFMLMSTKHSIDAEGKALDFAILAQIQSELGETDGPTPSVYVGKEQTAAIFHLARTFGVEQGTGRSRKLFGMEIHHHADAKPDEIVVGYPLAGSRDVAEAHVDVVVLLVVRNLAVDPVKSAMSA